MPMECEQLRDEPMPLDKCPKCGDTFRTFLRGQIQRSKRFLGMFKKQPYCALICASCENIVGWESPPKEN